MVQKKSITKIITVTAVLISVLFNLQNALAEGEVDTTQAEGVVYRIIDILTKFSTLAAVVFLIIAGYQYISSSGNPEKVQKAKQTFIGCLIGLFLVFVARLVASIVKSIATPL